MPEKSKDRELEIRIESQGLIYSKKRTRGLQVMLYCPLIGRFRSTELRMKITYELHVIFIRKIRAVGFCST